MSKTNYIWIINLFLLIAVVTLGIKQSEKGSEISKLENKIELLSSQKRDLSENIFTLSTEDKILEGGEKMGFIKPSNIYYFNTEDVSLTLR